MPSHALRLFAMLTTGIAAGPLPSTSSPAMPGPSARAGGKYEPDQSPPPVPPDDDDGAQPRDVPARHRTRKPYNRSKEAQRRRDRGVA